MGRRGVERRQAERLGGKKAFVSVYGSASLLMFITQA